MTIIKVTVGDEQAVSLRGILSEVSYVKKIEQEQVVTTDGISDSQSVSYRVKTILDKANRKNLFQDIEDPSKWQRELRREWNRDL
jgi:hypothetical protein